MTDNRPLTVSDLVALSTIVETVQHGSRVRWLSDDNDVLEGTARSIGDDRGMFLGNDEDVRDAFLRITSTSGFDYFVPMTKLAELVREGGFAIDS